MASRSFLERCRCIRDATVAFGEGHSSGGIRKSKIRHVDAVYSIRLPKLSRLRRKRCRSDHSCFMRSASSTSSRSWRIIETTRSCVVTMWSDGAKRRASRLATRSSMANVYPRWVATAIAEHSPAPRRPVADREAKRRSSSAAATGMRVRAPESSAEAKRRC